MLFWSRVHSGRWVSSGTCVENIHEWYWPHLFVVEQADGALVNGRSGQPSVRACLATAQTATPVSRNATVPEEQASNRPECEAVDLETILKERDACGVSHVFVASLLAPSLAGICVHRRLERDFVLQVGFIANLKSQRSHVIVEQVCVQWTKTVLVLKHNAWQAYCSDH